MSQSPKGVRNFKNVQDFKNIVREIKVCSGSKECDFQKCSRITKLVVNLTNTHELKMFGKPNIVRGFKKCSCIQKLFVILKNIC